MIFCYCYFDDIINTKDPYLDNVSLDEKPYENVLVYDVAYKTPYSVKSVFNENHSPHYYRVFLEKYSYVHVNNTKILHYSRIFVFKNLEFFVF